MVSGGATRRMQGTMNVMCANFGIEPFTSGLQWSRHRLLFDRFIRGGGEEAMYDGDIDFYCEREMFASAAAILRTVCSWYQV